MRMVKWSAFLTGVCVFALALGVGATSVSADVTSERGASILAFPKVLADGTADTVIQISNLSNSMVYARCYYVDARLDERTGRPIWQETDFEIKLTKQQPTHWLVSDGRFVNPGDHCFEDNVINPETCANAGFDPGPVVPVADGFIGELRCIEVDLSGHPIGGNHLKGEATIKTLAAGDVAKYSALGLEGTDLAGETDNTLRLDQPSDTDEVIGQYNACPERLILNHLTEGMTDPVVLLAGDGGLCEGTGPPCVDDLDCDAGDTCVDGSQILNAAGEFELVSATVNDLTLIPCGADYENQIPGVVTVQFEIYNEFEQRYSASTTVDCWVNFRLYEVDAATNPENSVFHYQTLGTAVAQTFIKPIEGDGGVIGVAGAVRANANGDQARVLLNLHHEGDRFTASAGDVVDLLILSDR